MRHHRLLGLLAKLSLLLQTGFHVLSALLCLSRLAGQFDDALISRTTTLRSLLLFRFLLLSNLFRFLRLFLFGLFLLLVVLKAFAEIVFRNLDLDVLGGTVVGIRKLLIFWIVRHA